jgi:hypothetical protein
MVGHHELVKPLSDLSEMVSCKDILVVISRVPYIRQNDWGRAVELFEVIKAGFTPFWFELRPVRTHSTWRNPSGQASVVLMPAELIARAVWRDLLRVEQRLIALIVLISGCVGRVAIALSTRMDIIFRRFKC